MPLLTVAFSVIDITLDFLRRTNGSKHLFFRSMHRRHEPIVVQMG